MSVLSDLTEAIRDGTIDVIDLTAPLSDTTPVIKLPEPFGNTAPSRCARSAGTTSAARPGTGTTSPPASTPAPTSTRRCTG